MNALRRILNVLRRPEPEAPVIGLAVKPKGEPHMNETDTDARLQRLEERQDRHDRAIGSLAYLIDRSLSKHPELKEIRNEWAERIEARDAITAKKLKELDAEREVVLRGAVSA
jgi:hypothetical protein